MVIVTELIQCLFAPRFGEKGGGGGWGVERFVIDHVDVEVVTSFRILFLILDEMSSVTSSSASWLCGTTSSPHHYDFQLCVFRKCFIVTCQEFP